MYQASSTRQTTSLGTIDPKNFQHFNVNAQKHNQMCAEHVECNFEYYKNNVQPHFDQQPIARQSSSQNWLNLIMHFMRDDSNDGKTMGE